ncbi:hypothetical protein EON67_01805, partial [archaeon]
MFVRALNDAFTKQQCASASYAAGGAHALVQQRYAMEPNARHMSAASSGKPKKARMTVVCDTAGTAKETETDTSSPNTKAQRAGASNMVNGLLSAGALASPSAQ